VAAIFLSVILGMHIRFGDKKVLKKSLKMLLLYFYLAIIVRSVV